MTDSNIYNVPWDLSSYKNCTVQPLVVPDGWRGRFIASGLHDVPSDIHQASDIGPIPVTAMLLHSRRHGVLVVLGPCT